MLGILLNAVVLIVLVKVINEDDDLGLGTAAGLAIGTSIVSFVAMLPFAAFGLIPAIIAGAFIGSLLLGIAISAFLGIEIKRSFIIAGLYMVISTGIGIAMLSMRGA
ncbi:MAG: hypothetical protein COA78_02150 [Blastopirellula sp.]|nr:MAG: hypothetical protein COA78_02150 [Blastopirellula sp.]